MGPSRERGVGCAPSGVAGMGIWREKQVLWYPPVQGSPLRANPEWLHNELEGAREAAAKRLSEAEQLENSGTAEATHSPESRRATSPCDPSCDAAMPNLRRSGIAGGSAEIARRLVEAPVEAPRKTLRSSMGRLRGSGSSMGRLRGSRSRSRTSGPGRVLPPQPARYAAIRAAFNRLDLNHNGEICVREMRSAVRSLGPRGSRASWDESVRQFIADADEDGNGRVSYPEFRQIVSKACCCGI